jgi:hypothetical protein
MLLGDGPKLVRELFRVADELSLSIVVIGEGCISSVLLGDGPKLLRELFSWQTNSALAQSWVTGRYTRALAVANQVVYMEQLGLDPILNMGHRYDRGCRRSHPCYRASLHRGCRI